MAGLGYRVAHGNDEHRGCEHRRHGAVCVRGRCTTAQLNGLPKQVNGTKVNPLSHGFDTNPVIRSVNSNDKLPNRPMETLLKPSHDPTYPRPTGKLASSQAAVGTPPRQSARMAM